MKSRWSEAQASELVARYGTMWGEDLALRTYTSRLLGADPSLVLHGGGNGSVKTLRTNLFGESLPALFVKASGRDMATIEPDGHTGLDLAPLERLRALPALDDEDMARELLIHRLQPCASPPSLETLTHAFIPETFIDHTHADAILALTNQPEGRAVVSEALGEDIIFLEYVHPGFDLARSAAEAYAANPGKRGMVWAHHGLLTWGSSARESYEAMVDLVSKAETFLARKASRKLEVPAPTALATAEARLASVAPVLRGLLAAPTGDPDRPHARMVLASLIDRETLDVVDSLSGKSLALSPPLTTDHLIRTKTLPLWVEDPSYEDEGRLRVQLSRAISEYAASYEAYVSLHAASMPPGIGRLDPRPRVVLLPGLGAVCAGAGLEAARIARDITAHTLRVKVQVAAMGRYVGPSEEDLFRMEYRSFQHRKLGGPASLRAYGGTSPFRIGEGAVSSQAGDRFAPFTGSEGLLAGQCALVTGAAGAIGSGLCRELLEHGCLVAATDLPGERLDGLVAELASIHGERILGWGLDVTDASSVEMGFHRMAREWGGVDLLIVNAGIAQVSPLAELDLDSFRRLERVNVEGTLLLLSEGARHFQRQGTGGDVVLISSKNVFSPGAGFGAYSATKAAAHQLARIASLELAPIGVRVNMVAPDAVFSDGSRRSGLWEEIGPERMRSRGLDARSLEEYYRNRNLLKARITARHVARAVLFLATRQAPMTGVTLPVDGGLPDATPR